MSKNHRGINNIAEFKVKIDKLRDIGLNRKQIAIRLGLTYAHIRSIERRIQKNEKV